MLGWEPNPSWPFLTGMPPVNFRVVTLTLLDFLTLAMIWHIAEIIVHHTEKAAPVDPLIEILIGIWLSFLAGMHGFALKAYGTKRNTSYDANADEEGTAPGDRADAFRAGQPTTTEMPAVPFAAQAGDGVRRPGA